MYPEANLLEKLKNGCFIVMRQDVLSFLIFFLEERLKILNKVTWKKNQHVCSSSRIAISNMILQIKSSTEYFLQMFVYITYIPSFVLLKPREQSQISWLNIPTSLQVALGRPTLQ